MGQPPPPAIEVFEQGFRFHSAANYLRSTNNTNTLFHAHPSIHLCCIAAELYLKCWIIRTKRRAVWGHNLHVLFQELDQRERAAISRRWRKEVDPAPYRLVPGLEAKLPPNFDLEPLLLLGNYMFLKSRYWFEQTVADNQSPFVLVQLPDVLFLHIVDAEPRWRPPISVDGKLAAPGEKVLP